ncbi:MAG: acyl-CoA dehydrogenase family protein [Actinomycetota bacterium]|nr:acyl-CoA dehydrogenase family protein [Actinomycetota bacterium]
MAYRSAWKDPEVTALGDLAATFFAKELVPHRDRFDAQKGVDRQLWARAGETGLLLCSIPSQYGGGGGTFAHEAAVFEAQGRAGDTGFGIAVHSGIVAHYLHAYGSEAQRQRWLPPMATGHTIGAIAMTEPGAGSDLKAMTTRAVRSGDGYLLNGSKTFISNGASCDLLIVACKTDPAAGARGISLLVAETQGLAGFSRGRTLDKLGMHGQDTAELDFADVVLPATSLLGEEGAGFAMLMNQLRQERLVIGLQAVAAMETALDETVTYAKTRQAFGGPLLDMQNTRFELAECATLVHAGRVFIDSCIERHLSGELDTPTASMAKWWLTELQCQVIDRCLQLFGGYGYMKEYLISRLYADARAQKIYGGANEVMKEVIARSL